MITIERRHDPTGTERILRALPDWFGIEESIREYVRDAAVKTSYLAVDHATTVGVALLHRHNAHAAELHLIAVHPDRRGRGVGTLLVDAMEEDLRHEGTVLLQVKTVGESFHHDGYAATRAFYRSRGFLPLEELDGIGWGGPTVIMVKSLV